MIIHSSTDQAYLMNECKYTNLVYANQALEKYFEYEITIKQGIYIFKVLSYINHVKQNRKSTNITGH